MATETEPNNKAERKSDDKSVLIARLTLALLVGGFTVWCIVKSQEDGYSGMAIQIGQKMCYGTDGLPYAWPLCEGITDLATHSVCQQRHDDFQVKWLKYTGNARTVSKKAKIEVLDTRSTGRLRMAMIGILDGDLRGKTGWVWQQHLWSEGAEQPKFRFPRIRHWHSETGVEFILD